jgi:alpha-galactosidase
MKLHACFRCNTVESDYKTAAQLLVSLGLQDLGYDYISLDCNWQGTNRTADGTFTWDTETIPDGIPALASYVHDLGFKFAIYSDAYVLASATPNKHSLARSYPSGYFACQNNLVIGSLGFEKQDAETFVGWGADYLKVTHLFFHIL